MLIEVYYGDANVLLVNGNCRPIHLINYIRTHCCLSSLLKFDLCLLNSGEPLHLSSFDSKFVSFERRCFPSHIRCVLTQIDEEGTYIPLLNDSTLITNEFLLKLRRATGAKVISKVISKSEKQSTNSLAEEAKARRTLKSFVIAASIMNKTNH
ncbi:unnamed protein product [Rotaria sp. Silwood1]|nr:unnamed protein product [Rotaria sp. Silwood1]CAF1551609.1 unnamed protein product [Rotaria sp. Silwood1]CAF3703217.1 unnamed protein product [Rotaria sp. Silwood1]CAF3752779.1 unnamed protein product [Rotaria sp. Silwood1]CAF4761745.1 unnamed protein product [Rotaria sp. Silwood1]